MRTINSPMATTPATALLPQPRWFRGISDRRSGRGACIAPGRRRCAPGVAGPRPAMFRSEQEEPHRAEPLAFPLGGIFDVIWLVVFPGLPSTGALVPARQIPAFDEQTVIRHLVVPARGHAVGVQRANSYGAVRRPSRATTWYSDTFSPVRLAKCDPLLRNSISGVLLKKPVQRTTS